MTIPFRPSASVLSVNVGQPRATSGTREARTAIGKTPVAGPTLATRLGLVGDAVGSPDVHGGVDMAVYAYAREDLHAWQRELGLQLPDGWFGENLTTLGIDVNAALVGERWRIGGALLEIAKVRIPCNTFQLRIAEAGGPDRGWVKRFTQAAIPGPYLRVLEEGEIAAGDAIEVVHRPDHGITVSHMFRALTTDPALLPDLAVIEGLATSVRSKVDVYTA
ncbi:MOSC domain-containing protein [Nocardioides jiangxiensis]|uniref:MOSC domain-containing protein n=1 Tax=Nocardioides jiangxiensis TaxID=3064524 RepID=A0ABT9AXD1_9ACTN|nr:MOSC domain-containing protein [Nocardioides sp. WY-20]MDO7867192.1 MOSC domain-containing protein [Nocardioides sp. WY-20]